MKRAPVVLTATAAGLAATLGFTPHSKAPTATAVTTAPAAAPSPSSAKTVVGDSISTQYGRVQLRVTVDGGKITKVEALQLPSNDPKSVQIGSYAEPQLQQSALAKQNGAVDAVSGATYTSAGYQTALQSALDKAGFQASRVSPTA